MIMVYNCFGREYTSTGVLVCSDGSLLSSKESIVKEIRFLLHHANYHFDPFYHPTPAVLVNYRDVDRLLLNKLLFRLITLFHNGFVVKEYHVLTNEGFIYNVPFMFASRWLSTVVCVRMYIDNRMVDKQFCPLGSSTDIIQNFMAKNAFIKNKSVLVE